mgnify:CR=1 FL=1
MIYFYNYNFIKYLNSAWSFIFLLLFANITLLLLTSTCLADGENNPNSNPNTNLEGKEIINNLPEDNIVRKTCEETGISLSDAIFQHKMQLKVAERAKQAQDLQVRLVEADIYLEAEKKRRVADSLTSNEGLQGWSYFEEEVTFKKLPTPVKLFIGTGSFALGSGCFAKSLATFSMQPPINGGIAACKLPFIVNPVAVPMIVRVTAGVGAGFFLAGVYTGGIDLGSLDFNLVISLINPLSIYIHLIVISI